MQNKVWEQVGDFLNKLRCENVTRDTTVEVPGYRDTQQELEEMRGMCEEIIRSLPEDQQQTLTDYLFAFVVIDYITGVMCAVADKKLSSEVGFKCIYRKVLIFLLVGIANIFDVQVIGTGSVLRTAVIFFYISNEGVSLLENAGHLGLPVPERIKTVLEQLHDRSESEEN